ncbi:MAG TPA: DUF881 domain-containing protein [Candidatus Angelobacter sp.]|nr:DUF881 domain-containing protein [Candidatus Angelobacter sp.]
MSGRVAQLSLFAVAILIGVLLVGQLRSQAPVIELSNLSAQELSTLIETLQARNVELSDGLADLREQIRDYEREESQGQSVLDLTREDRDRFLAFGGQLPVTGQGIVLQVEGDFDPSHVNDLIHELRNAGAEAIAVDDVRVTARSVAQFGTDAIEIDGVPIGRFFEIRAIGAPRGLQSALERPGGILRQLGQLTGGTFRLTDEASMSVPATQRDLSPQAGRPVE